MHNSGKQAGKIHIHCSPHSITSSKTSITATHAVSGEYLGEVRREDPGEVREVWRLLLAGRSSCTSSERGEENPGYFLVVVFPNVMCMVIP